MSGSLSLTALIIAIALAAFVADRSKWFSRRKWAIGVLFGILGILANSMYGVTFSEYGFNVELRDAAPVVAAFFFGPLAGFVAGAITAIERAIAPFWGQGAFSLCPLATFLTTLYAIAFSRWLADGKRPSAVQAVLAGAYAEVLHISLDILFCLCDGVVIEIVYIAIIPEALVIAASAGLSAIACRASENWKASFFSPLTAVLSLFAIAFSLVATTVMRKAVNSADDALVEALQSCEEKVDAQIGYMMHCNGVSLAKRIRSAKSLSRKEMSDWATIYDIDELNLMNTNGIIVASNEPSVDIGFNFFRDGATSQPFYCLINGKSQFVKQKFRQSFNDPNIVAKYIGVKLPEGGFIELGYFKTRLRREFETFFVPMLAGTGFGHDGYLVIADADDNIVGAVRGHGDMTGTSLKSVGLISSEHAGGEPYTATIFGKGCRCLPYRDVSGWQVYAVLPLIEVYGPANLSVVVAGFVLFALCVIFRLVELRFRKARQKIDAMRAQELMVAQAIQTGELRRDSPQTDEYGVYAEMHPAREVGGDFYDYYTLSDGRLVVTIADVSGKGVPAAIFMMKAMIALKDCMMTCPSFTEAVVAANRRLCQNNRAEMFVTAWIGVFDPKSGVLEYVSAGHNPPLVKRSDGSIEWIRSRRSLVLAAMPEVAYHSQSLVLKSGDSLCLYTDGVTEAMNERGELFGEPRLEYALRKASRLFVTELCEAVHRFAGRAEQSDDITMLALDVK